MPGNIIPRARMTDLLVQVHITDGHIVSLTQNPDSLYKYGMGRYIHLFETFHTDTAQFKRSVMYYANRPEVFDQMYDEVVKILNSKVDSLNKVRTNIAKIDSSKNAHRSKQITDSVTQAKKKELLLKRRQGIN